MNEAVDGQTLRTPWEGTPRHHCFGCASHNPAGLAMKMAQAGDTLICDFTLTRLHESYPGLIHGGVSAALLDELMGNVLIQRERKVCFTTSLRITYAGVLLVGSSYRAVAWLHERPKETEDLFRVVGEIHDQSGQTLVMARGTFQWMTAGEWRRSLGENGEPDDSLRTFLRPEV